MINLSNDVQQFAEKPDLLSDLTVLVNNSCHSEEWADFVTATLVLYSVADRAHIAARLWAHLEVSRSSSASTIFRESSCCLKGLQRYCTVVAKSWFKTITSPITPIIKTTWKKSPTPQEAASDILRLLVDHVEEIPARIVQVFKHVQSCVANKFGDVDFGQRMVGVAFFLYFITPCICDPYAFGLVSREITDVTRLTKLTQISKLIQQSVNRAIQPSSSSPSTTTTEHEKEMIGLVQQFIDKLCVVDGVDAEGSHFTRDQTLKARDVISGYIQRFEQDLSKMSSSSNHNTLLDNAKLDVAQLCKCPENLQEDMLAAENGLRKQFLVPESGSAEGLLIAGERYTALLPSTIRSLNHPSWKSCWLSVGQSDADLIRRLLQLGNGIQHILSAFPYLSLCGWGRFAILARTKFVSPRNFTLVISAKTPVEDEPLLWYLEGWMSAATRSSCTVAQEKNETACTISIHCIMQPTLSLDKLVSNTTTPSTTNSYSMEVFSKERDAAFEMPSSTSSDRVLVRVQQFLREIVSEEDKESVARQLFAFGSLAGTYGFASSQQKSFHTQCEEACAFAKQIGLGECWITHSSPTNAPSSRFTWCIATSTWTMEPKISCSCIFTSALIGQILSRSTGERCVCVEMQCMSKGYAECKFICCFAETSAEIVSLAFAATDRKIEKSSMLAISVPQQKRSLFKKKYNSNGSNRNE